MARTNMAVAVLVGAILLALLGFIPVFGAIIAGFAAGMIAGGGAGRGAVAGFLSGIIGGVILAIILVVAGSAVGAYYSIYSEILGGSIAIVAGILIIILSLGGAILAGIGGFVGGLVKEQKYGGLPKTDMSNVPGDKSSKMDDRAKTSNQDMVKMPAAPNAARMDATSDADESSSEGDRANRYANSYKTKKAGNNR